MGIVVLKPLFYLKHCLFHACCGQGWMDGCRDKVFFKENLLPLQGTATFEGINDAGNDM